MRSREPESLLLVPLLPIFFVGAFPMLLLSLLGFGGLVIFGILLICVGFTDTLEANSAFSEQVIVHGYTRQIEEAYGKHSGRSEDFWTSQPDALAAARKVDEVLAGIVARRKTA